MLSYVVAKVAMNVQTVANNFMQSNTGFVVCCHIRKVASKVVKLVKFLRVLKHLKASVSKINESDFI